MKYKVLLNSHYFTATAGGTDLFIKILNNLLVNNKYEYFVLIPKNNFISTLRKLYFPIREFLRQIIQNQKKELKYWPMQQGSNEVFNFLKKKKFFKIIDADYINITRIIKKINPDIIYPCLYPLAEFKNKNIGYIFDLQHEYFSNFFTKNDINKKRSDILNVYNYSKIIIVNSKHTRETLLKKYKNNFSNKKIYSIPFYPSVPDIFFDWNLDLKKKYKIKNEYFMICNQFWKHKNHKFAIKAFIKYCLLGGTHDLVMSGKLEDRRFPNYSSEIKSIIYNSNFNDRIKILGLIEKKNQISLLRNAKALIQPTLFEGGPGGGSVNEAVALDVPVIASNISINLEIKSKNIEFFNPFNINELVKLFFKNQRNKIKTTPNSILKIKSKKQIKNLNLFYDKVFNLEFAKKS